MKHLHFTFLSLIFPIIALANSTEKINLVSTGQTTGCSGSLIAFEGYNTESKALYMTNGHCTYINDYFDHYLAPGEIITNLPKHRKVKLFRNKFNLFGQKTAKIFTTKVLFATMSVRDIAIYELELSYNEIQDQFNLEPLIVLNSSEVKQGSRLQIISGYWEDIWTCFFKEESKNEVHAGPYNWTNVLVMNKCDKEIIGGTSGSPTVLEGTRYVVGLHNARDNFSDKRCSLYDACEKNTEGVIVSQSGDAFSQNLDFLFSCIDDDNNFQAELCVLPDNT